VWTAYRAAKAGLIESDLGEVCPSCGERVREDIPHILLECECETETRQALIKPAIDEAVDMLPALPNRREIAVLILGGQVGEATLRPTWLKGAAHVGGAATPSFARVAEFLQIVMPRRMGRLWSMRAPQRTDNAPVSNPHPGESVNAQDGYGRPTSGRARRTREVFSGVEIPTLPGRRLVFDGVVIPKRARR
jgi:hypothetical protein